jgi:hypothetical protein
MKLRSGLMHLNDVTTPKLVGFGLGFLLLVVVCITDADGYIFLIDDANLLFHEAGHVIFGIFGRSLGLYGGTLGQLVFPVVTAMVFIRQKSLVSFAVSMLWLFENFLNISRYMADARAHRLPLVGSGDHDWTRIFSSWGVLPYDTAIASVIRVMGWLGMVGTLVFVVVHWYQTRKGSAERA